MRQTSIAIRNASVGLFTQVVSVGIGLVLFPYIIRKIGNEAYGLFLMALSLEAALDLFRSALGRTSTVVVAQARELGDDSLINRTLSAAVLFALFPGLLGFIALAGGGSFLHGFFNISQGLYVQSLIVFAMAGMVMLISFLLFPLHGVLSGYQRYNWFYGLKLAGTLLRFGLTVALLKWIRADVVCVMIAWSLTIIATEVGIAIAAYRTHPALRLSLRSVKKADFKPLAVFGSFIMLTQVMLTIDSQAGRWITGKTLGIEFVTFLVIAGMLLQLAYQLVQQVTVILVPIAGRYQALGAADTLQELFLRSNRYAVLMAGIMLAGMLPQIKTFLQLWMGADFVWLAPYAMLMGATAVISSASSCAQQVLQGAGYAKSPLYGISAAAVSSIITMLLLVVVFKVGFVGIIIGFCLGQLLRWFLLTVISVRVIGGSPMRLFWEGYAQPLLAVVVAMTCVKVLGWRLGSTSWTSLILLAGAGSTAVILTMLPFLKTHEWEIIRAALLWLRRLVGGRWNISENTAREPAPPIGQDGSGPADSSLHGKSLASGPLAPFPRTDSQSKEII